MFVPEYTPASKASDAIPALMVPAGAQLSSNSLDELRIRSIEILDCTFPSSTGYLIVDELGVCCFRK
jgi:hypothetical protein